MTTPAAALPFSTATATRVALVAAGLALAKAAADVVAGVPLTVATPDLAVGLVLAVGSVIALGLACVPRPRAWLHGLVLLAALAQLGAALLVWVRATDSTLAGLHGGGRRATLDLIDAGVANAAATEVVLAGRNPYVMPMSTTIAAQRTLQFASTPRLDGGLNDRLAYPAFSFLSALPFALLGLPANLMAGVAGYALSLGALWGAAPGNARGVVLVPLLALTAATGLLVAGDFNFVWSALLVLAVLRWDHPWQRAILIGLAVATKQNAWLVTPFLLVRVWGDEGRGRAGQLVAVAAGVFALLNAPWMVASPRDWLLGVLQPVADAMVPFSDGGLSSLQVFGWVALPPLAYTLALVAGFGVALWAYARHLPTLRETAWVLPGLLMMLSERSLMSYWYFLVLPGLAVWAREVARAEVVPVDDATFPARPPEATRRARPWVTVGGVAGAFALLVLAGWLLARPHPLRVVLDGPLVTNARGNIDTVTLRLVNNGATPISLGVFLQREHGTAYPWPIVDGPDVLAPGAEAVLVARAPQEGVTFSPAENAVLLVFDVLGGQVAGRWTHTRATAFFVPDALQNPDFRVWALGADAPVSWPFSSTPPGAGTLGYAVVNGREALVMSLAEGAGGVARRAEVRQADASFALVAAQETLGVWVRREVGQDTVLAGLSVRVDAGTLFYTFDPPGRPTLARGQALLSVETPPGVWVRHELPVAADLARLGRTPVARQGQLQFAYEGVVEPMTIALFVGATAEDSGAAVVAFGGIEQALDGVTTTSLLGAVAR